MPPQMPLFKATAWKCADVLRLHNVGWLPHVFTRLPRWPRWQGRESDYDEMTLGRAEGDVLINARLNVFVSAALYSLYTVVCEPMYEDGNPDGCGEVHRRFRYPDTYEGGRKIERERHVKTLVSNECSTPISLRKRPEDIQRWVTRESNANRPWYEALLAIGCTAFNLPQRDDQYQEKLLKTEEACKSLE